MANFPQITPILNLDLESINRLVIQLTEANAQMAIEIAQLKGEDGRIATLSSNLDLQGNIIQNVGQTTGEYDVPSRAELRQNALYADRGQPHRTRQMIEASGGVRVPKAIARNDALPLEQASTMMGNFVSGPATSTNNAIARWDGATGRLLEDSVIGTAIASLTDSSAGTANDTVQALTNPTDTPVTADALRDDLVANLIPELRNNFADVTAKINLILVALRDVFVIAT